MSVAFNCLETGTYLTLKYIGGRGIQKETGKRSRPTFLKGHLVHQALFSNSAYILTA